MTKKNRTPDIVYPELIKVNPNSLVLWRPRKEYTNRSHFNDLHQFEETTTLDPKPKITATNKTNGFLSDRAGSRLRKSIKYLLWLSGCFRIQQNKMVLRPSGHISFITLTLCYTQLHSDNYVKKYLLGQFLTELTFKNPSIKFIWRAEKQVNGNIHFHLLVNSFVPWKWIAITWNRILKKEGYLMAYQVKFRNMSFEEYVLTIADFNIDKIHKYKLRWKKGNDEDWTNPPSTHVEDMRTAKEIVYYMSKYLTKNSHDPEKLTAEEAAKLKVEGHLYYCCAELNKIKGPSEMLSPAIVRELDLLYSLCPDSFLYSDFYTVIRISVDEVFNLGCYVLYTIFASHLNSLKPTDMFSP